MTFRPKRANPGDHIRRRDSKVSHESEASGQPFQDGAQTLRSNSIQKELTRSVCVVPTLNATEGYGLDFTRSAQEEPINKCTIVNCLIRTCKCLETMNLNKSELNFLRPSILLPPLPPAHFSFPTYVGEWVHATFSLHRTHRGKSFQ